MLIGDGDQAASAASNRSTHSVKRCGRASPIILLLRTLSDVNHQAFKSPTTALVADKSVLIYEVPAT
jgi:hypothetical protein